MSWLTNLFQPNTELQKAENNHSIRLKGYSDLSLNIILLREPIDYFLKSLESECMFLFESKTEIDVVKTIIADLLANLFTVETIVTNPATTLSDLQTAVTFLNDAFKHFDFVGILLQQMNINSSSSNAFTKKLENEMPMLIERFDDARRTAKHLVELFEQFYADLDKISDDINNIFIAGKNPQISIEKCNELKQQNSKNREKLYSKKEQLASFFPLTRPSTRLTSLILQQKNLDNQLTTLSHAIKINDGEHQNLENNVVQYDIVEETFGQIHQQLSHLSENDPIVAELLQKVEEAKIKNKSRNALKHELIDEINANMKKLKNVQENVLITAERTKSNVSDTTIKISKNQQVIGDTRDKQIVNIKKAIDVIQNDILQSNHEITRKASEAGIDIFALGALEQKAKDLFDTLKSELAKKEKEQQKVSKALIDLQKFRNFIEEVEQQKSIIVDDLNAENAQAEIDNLTKRANELHVYLNNEPADDVIEAFTDDEHATFDKIREKANELLIKLLEDRGFLQRQLDSISQWNAKKLELDDQGKEIRNAIQSLENEFNSPHLLSSINVGLRRAKAIENQLKEAEKHIEKTNIWLQKLLPKNKQIKKQLQEILSQHQNFVKKLNKLSIDFQNEAVKLQELNYYKDLLRKAENDIVNIEQNIHAILPNDVSSLENVNEKQLIPLNKFISIIDALPIPNDEMNTQKTSIKNRLRDVSENFAKMLDTAKKLSEIQVNTNNCCNKLSDLIRNAHYILTNSYAQPISYHDHEQRVIKKIHDAHKIIHDANASGNSIIIKPLNDLILQAQKVENDLASRYNLWLEFVKERDNAKNQVHQARNVLNDFEANTSLLPLNVAEHQLGILKAASNAHKPTLLKLQGLSEQLNPCEMPYADVRFIEKKWEQINKKFEYHLTNLNIEITEERGITDGINKVIDEINSLNNNVRLLAKESLTDIKEKALPRLHTEIERLTEFDTFARRNRRIVVRGKSLNDVTAHLNEVTQFLHQRIMDLECLTADDAHFYTIPKCIKNDEENFNVVGIDLGMSRCCVAVKRKNGIETVALENTGERLLPSYVGYDEKNLKCGQVVVDRLRHYSEYSVFDFKRIIGKNMIVPDKVWPFTVEIVDNKVVIKVNTPQGYISQTATQVSAVLLKYMKEKTEAFQGQKLSKVVITVPAAFSVFQEKATLEAAQQAGWETIKLLPEPIAASFAYFADKEIPNNSNLFLFDLGGGTMDVCIFKIENNQIQITSKSGDAEIGGRNFDNILMDFFIKKLSLEFGVSEKCIKEKKYKLLQECQRIKHNLSVRESEQLDVEDINPSKNGFIHITQNEFQALADQLLKKIENSITSALHKSNYKASEINKVLHVGGGCRMPMIIGLLKKMFPLSEHCCWVNPDEVVAIGAAYYAYNIFPNTGHL